MASILSVDAIQGATTAANVKLPEGCIIGWKTVSSATSVQVTGTTFVDLPGISLSYACKYSTSILYFMFNTQVFIPQQTSAWQSAGTRILKGSSTVLITESGYGSGHYTDSSNDRFMHHMVLSTAHSPASTSSETYKVQVAKLQGSDYADFQNSGYGAGSRLTVMEIAQ